MDQKRLLESGPGFELSQQAVHVMDVPGAFDLGHHDDVELVPDGAHEFGDVVEHPGAVEAVDAGPELAGSEIRVLSDLDQALSRGDLLVGRHGVFEVAQQHVALGDHVGDLGRHLRITRIEEVDHARGAQGDLVQRVRGPEGHGLEEVFGVTHGKPSWADWICEWISRSSFFKD